MSSGAVYSRFQGADLPDTPVVWRDDTEALHQFATGWSFAVVVRGEYNRKPLITKSSGITGADTAPNLTIAWSTSEIRTLDAGRYRLQITATRTADNKRLILDELMVLEPTATA